MVRSYKFSIVRLAPGGVRDERINIGMVVFHTDRVDIRLPTRLEKIRVISAALDQGAVRNLVEAIEDRDQEIRTAGIADTEARARAVGELGPLKLSSLGSFTCNTALEYEARIGSIFESIIDPEPAPKSIRPKRSRLLTELKRTLRSRKILAAKDEDLLSHRVVPNLQLAEGLVADLAIRNGAMHIIETVDISAADTTPRRAVSDIAVSALILEQARINFGELGTHARLVYNAAPSVEMAAKNCLDAAEHQGAELLNWASTQDQIKLISSLSDLAIPLPTASEKRRRSYQGNIAALKLTSRIK